MANKTKQKKHADIDYSLEAVPETKRKKFWPMFFYNAWLYFLLSQYVSRCKARQWT